MTTVRKPAVAGSFYPAEADALAAQVAGYLAAVPASGQPVPKAIIAPHAGYIYSAPIAASVYARLAPAHAIINRVVLLGPSHRVAFRGIAGCMAEAYETPLGRIPLDRELLQKAASVPGAGILDAAHEQEHSLEVHLPFLQTVLDQFTLLPLVVGDAPPELVAQVLDAVWGGPETLIVISTDLSHYLDYDAARSRDAATRQAIEQLDSDALASDQACGRMAMNGLLLTAKGRGMTIETVDLRNSGDTAGPRDRVVGYGAWALTEPSADEALRRHSDLILDLAHDAIIARLQGQTPALPADLPFLLHHTGAAFVTLKRDGQLRGCIGSAIGWRPLGQDILDNAQKAAFDDPRFPPLRSEELDGLELSVSVLTPPVPMVIASEADLLAQLRPGIDGLIIEDGPHRALFLPSVWESLSTPADFLGHLKRKAGMAPSHWSDHFKASRFRAVEIKRGE